MEKENNRLYEKAKVMEGILVRVIKDIEYEIRVIENVIDGTRESLGAALDGIIEIKKYLKSKHEDGNLE